MKSRNKEKIFELQEISETTRLLHQNARITEDTLMIGSWIFISGVVLFDKFEL